MTKSGMFALGFAIGLFDPQSEKISGVARGNVSDCPHASPAILRHVFGDMLRDPAVASWVNAVAITKLRSFIDGADFWLGINCGASHATAGRRPSPSDIGVEIR